jgi:hypothetical protein
MLRKKIFTIMIASSMMIMNITPAFAGTGFTGDGIGGVKTELPVYELPELSPLEMPTLSKNYESMAEEMVDLGFGSYRFKGGLPLPDVEAPVGTGANAVDVFTSTFGDLWSDPDRQLSKESTLPAQEVLNAASSFSLQAQTSFDAIKSKDSEMMASLLAKKLDTSKNWDLSDIKSRLPSISANAMKTYLGSTEKPSAWGAEPRSISLDSLAGVAGHLAGLLGVGTEGGMIKQIDTDGNVVESASILSSGTMLNASDPDDVTAAGYMATLQNINNSAAGIPVISLVNTTINAGAEMAKKKAIKDLLK